jgi:NAD+ synthase
VAQARVAETGLPLLYVNQVGGQDELVFEGGQLRGAGGRGDRHEPADVRRSAGAVDLGARGGRLALHPGAAGRVAGPAGGDYRAMVLGLRDYVDKTGFPGVVLGMSGGSTRAYRRRWRWTRWGPTGCGW